MVKVKLSRVFVAVVIALMATMMSCESGSNNQTLTVKEVIIRIPIRSIDLLVAELKMVDGKGKAIIFSDSPKNWFENATLQSITIPKNNISIGVGNVLADDTKLMFKFIVNDTIYPIGVGTGSKFVVHKTNEGKYTLLPKETAKLSPPPIIEVEEQLVLTAPQGV